MGERLRYEANKDSWEWLRFAAGLPSRPYQFVGITASQQLLRGRYLVRGVSINNAATTSGVLTLYDGEDTNGVIIIPQHFSASGTVTQPLDSNGVYATIGVYLGVVTGTLSGCVWAVPLAEYDITVPGT